MRRKAAMISVRSTAVLAELQYQLKFLGGWDEAEDSRARSLIGVTFGAGLLAVHHAERKALCQVFHLLFVGLAGHLQ